MFTTFDRYLLGRMLHTFGVFLVATYGLYIVIDLFTNIDAFQLVAQRAADRAALSGGAEWSDQAVFWDMSKRIGMYYSFRLSEFLQALL